MTKDQERGGSTLTIQQDKMVEESLKEVAQGGPGGNYLNQQVCNFFMLTKIRICKTEICVIFTRMFSKRIFSETWALPITVVIAVMAYVALASTFYNMDV